LGGALCRSANIAIYDVSNVCPMNPILLGKLSLIHIVCIVSAADFNHLFISQLGVVVLFSISIVLPPSTHFIVDVLLLCA